jgi:hypothetical protein
MKKNNLPMEPYITAGSKALELKIIELFPKGFNGKPNVLSIAYSNAQRNGIFIDEIKKIIRDWDDRPGLDNRLALGVRVASKRVKEMGLKTDEEVAFNIGFFVVRDSILAAVKNSADKIKDKDSLNKLINFLESSECKPEPLSRYVIPGLTL